MPALALACEACRRGGPGWRLWDPLLISLSTDCSPASGAPKLCAVVLPPLSSGAAQDWERDAGELLRPRGIALAVRVQVGVRAEEGEGHQEENSAPLNRRMAFQMPNYGNLAGGLGFGWWSVCPLS